MVRVFEGWDAIGEVHGQDKKDASYAIAEVLRVKKGLCKTNLSAFSKTVPTVGGCWAFKRVVPKTIAVRFFASGPKQKPLTLL